MDEQISFTLINFTPICHTAVMLFWLMNNYSLDQVKFKKNAVPRDYPCLNLFFSVNN